MKKKAGSKGQLTKRQGQILKILRGSIDPKACHITIREIADMSGIKSPNGVMCHLRALEKKGYIAMRGQIARGIRIAE